MKLTAHSKQQIIQLGQTLVGLILINLFFIIMSGTYRQMGNFYTILSQSVVLGCLAAGATVVLISGGLDLSIGSIVALVSITAGTLLIKDTPVWLVVVLSLGVGALCGLISGLIIVITDIPAFIATLGMMMAFRGLAEVFGGGTDMSMFPDSFVMLGQGYTYPVTILIVACILIWLFLSQTRLGFNAYAIGGNQEVSRLSGINVKANRVLFYLMGGLLAALGAIIETAMLDFATPNRGSDMELNAIAAVIIGGTSMSGGMGGVGRTLIGVLIMTSLSSGMSHMGVTSSWQRVAIGSVIILAVWIDTIQGKKRERAR